MEKNAKTAAVSELRARLSKYLERVKAGEEIVITRRGTPVARLTPISREKTRRIAMASFWKAARVDQARVGQAP